MIGQSQNIVKHNDGRTRFLGRRSYQIGLNEEAPAIYAGERQSLVATGNWLRGLTELTFDTAPGKGHEGRFTERFRKEAAEEMPDTACNLKSYSLPGFPVQPVRLAYIWWKLSYGDQTHNCPRRPMQP